ncbi:MULTISPECIES: hypothetical protein [Burkholderia]|uniref:Uncharacterized protein n=1 Tax=Burkholderia savannae TaxID=1637837 RepID=A0ABR5TF90_9BURK|nr:MULTISPECIES: hypothetical protein [Burkholderia]AOJ69531.1 hypothetical protein WS78_12750 [Burkholderia savannae]AOJ81445.1 hypothetical protein WS86_13065 [Burkholderia savannae]AOK47652.1 hypothetical protein WT60_12945 [Burkholderia sp. MSMB617WGS]KGR95154.1 hypothetical protein X946_5190 [Burkholderia sp. ABCPW 111]KVG50372.1 hypothetical protein WS77_23775 [Burkholderia sp. MSMB0265]
MKRAIEILDLILKVLSCIAILVAGGWAAWIFWLGGSTDWQNNITLDTQVLPYHDNLRLLVIHAKSKNPRNSTFALTSSNKDTYQLRVRKLPVDAKAGTVFHEDEGELVASANLLERAGDSYEFLPNAEMDDMQAVVLPAGSMVSVIAEMKIHAGTYNSDENSTSAIVRIAP